MKKANELFTNELKCIKVTHNGEQQENISYEQFEQSFIKERWNGERRTQKKATIFGVVHTKTTVTNPYSNEKSVRVFDFPKSPEQAKIRHDEYVEVSENETRVN